MLSRIDALIRDVASRQHGVVTRAQLLRLGASPSALDNRLRTGRLERLHRGVYRVGPLSVPHEREWAAVLACGGGGAWAVPGEAGDSGTGPDRGGAEVALSHGSAAALLGLLPPVPKGRAVDVTGPRSLRGRPGIRVHRAVELSAAEVVRVDGLPVTKAARTLVDLAADTATTRLERAVARAVRERLLTLSDLRASLSLHRWRPGRRTLERLLDAVGEPELTRSEAEVRLLALLRTARLPRPRVNAVVEGVEVDFLWRGPRLVVEVDGFAFHAGRAAFERDRDRDARLAAAGYQVVRVTWRQLDQRPMEVVVRLAQALVQGR